MWRKLKMCDEKSYVMALAEISCQSAAQDLDGVGSSRLANYFLFSGPSRLRLSAPTCTWPMLKTIPKSYQPHKCRCIKGVGTTQLTPLTPVTSPCQFGIELYI
jgi:hypothetical protein